MTDDLTTRIADLPPEFEAVREYAKLTTDERFTPSTGTILADAAITELLEALDLRDEMLERAAGMFAKRASTPLYKNRPNEWLADLRASAERGT